MPSWKYRSTSLPTSRRSTVLMGAGGVMVAAGLVLAVTAFALPGPKNDTNASLTSSALSPRDGATATPFVQPTTPEATTSPGPTPTTTHPSGLRKVHVRSSPATTRPAAATTSPAAHVPTLDAAPTPTVSSSPSSTDVPTVAPVKKDGIVLADVLLKNVGTGDCADLPGTGSAAFGEIVAEYTCAGGDGDNQAFKLAYSGDEFMMENVVSQKCLDLVGLGSVAAGSDVMVNPCMMGDSDNLMFRKEAVKGGLHIINAKSDLCLDISKYDVSYLRLDKKLTLAPCSSATTQTWKLKTVS